MKINGALFVVVVALSGCTVWGPGKDPNGRALLEKANVILAAVINLAIKQRFKYNGA